MNETKVLAEDLIDIATKIIKYHKERIVKLNKKIIKLQNCKNKECFKQEIKKYKKYIKEYKQDIKYHEEDIRELNCYLT